MAFEAGRTADSTEQGMKERAKALLGKFAPDQIKDLAAAKQTGVRPQKKRC